MSDSRYNRMTGGGGGGGGPSSLPHMNGNSAGSRRPLNITRTSSSSSYSSSATTNNYDRPSSSLVTFSQHEDLIRYISDSWSKISQEIDRNSTGGGPQQTAGHHQQRPSVRYYQDQQACHNLKDFEPFDLEGFCDRRLMMARQLQQQQQQSYHNHSS